jgi:hypothetical protein
MKGKSEQIAVVRLAPLLRDSQLENGEHIRLAGQSTELNRGARA